MNKKICLNQSVLDFMAGVLTPSSAVLELGAGWSSAWFAKRCGRLVTVETDRRWSTLVGTDLRQAGFNNWHMITASPVPLVLVATVDRYMEESVDLALVDCREDLRRVAADLAWRYLRPGGWVVFDDAQRARHQGSVDWLQEKAGDPTRLEWAPGDIESAVDRLALAWQKPAI